MSDAKAYFEITQDKLAQKGFHNPPRNLKEAKANIKDYVDRAKKK